MTETLQDKGKRLQKQRDYKIDVDKYVLVHVDGRSFSKLIKNKFNKPFDDKFIDMMNKTAIFLCESIQGAKIAYVQSDEISLLLKKDSPEGDIFFG
jgi:tRNA(His) 5'-end guanylyltransferase